MKGEDLTVLEQTTRLSHAFVEATLTISLKNITSEVKFAERKSTLLQNNKVWKKSAYCSVTTYNPAVRGTQRQFPPKYIENTF